MKNIILFNNKFFIFITLFLFSFLVNQYYGNIGVFPVDSFSHFDTGYRILLNEHPFKDYWIISGPLVDYFQALFFYLFGVNWQIYILHASIINAILTIITYIVLINFNLNPIYSFIYSLFFSILAYPSSGTPFVDHHSAFFSLIGIYFLILAIKNNVIYYWILLPIAFIFAFLSKQVPATYIIISAIIILIYYSISLKKFKWIFYSFLSFIFTILFVIIFGKFQGISLSSFLEQYILYPQTIGNKRFSNLGLDFSNLITHFKFIYISLLPLAYINLKNLFSEKKYFKSKDFFYFLILILLTFSLIFHQLLTRNQTFIFFLIPILIAFSHISINSNKLIISVILILFCLGITTKYHLRFNENRKFHELIYSDFNLAVNADKIDKKFSGLKWISPEYSKNPDEEINLINEMKNYFKNDNRNKMIMTNYSFFSAILENKTFSTTRWHIFDGTDYPQVNSKYFISYKKLIINSLRNNNIKVVYIVHPVQSSNLYDYVDDECFQESKINKILTSYEIKNCKEIDG